MQATVSVVRLEPLDNGAGRQRTAAAHRHEPVRLVAALELVQNRRDQPTAGRADGVADGDGATVHVDLVHVGIVHAGPTHHDGGEGLVHLEEVDVLHGHAG